MKLTTETHEHHGSGYKVYFLVWSALVVLTVVTVYVSYIDFGIFNIVLAMVIASIKASIVALYFMHLKFEDSLTWVFALYPLSLLFLLIAMTMIDTFTRQNVLPY